jgi:hypothetical protein
MNKEELVIYMNIIIEKEFDERKRVVSTYCSHRMEGNGVIVYEHSDTLMTLFSTIQTDSELKEVFIAMLETGVQNAIDIEIRIADINTNASIMSLCFYTLVRLGFTERALDALEKRKDEAGDIFYLISIIMQEDFIFFNDKEIFRLLTIIRELPSSTWNPRPRADSLKQYLISILNKSSYDIIKRKLKGVNIEINQDKNKVGEMLTSFGLDPKYDKLLGVIDQFIYSDNEIITAGMIGNLRSFMENLFTDLAKKIAISENEEIPKYEGLKEMGCIRKYLKTKLELSDNDHRFINAFICILHSEGGHSFISNKEYFRLTKNIGIEIVLLLLYKFEVKYPKEK